MDYVHFAWVKVNQLTKGWVPPPPAGAARKHVLVVHAHPETKDSYSAALAAAAVDGLQSAGHRVTFLSLYDTKFQPALTLDERRRYFGPTPLQPKLPSYPTPSRDVESSVALLRECDSLVLVYPTWWFNVPGILKGWLDRTFTPGVAFKLPHLEAEAQDSVMGLIPGLPNIKKFGIITTFGAPRHIAFLAGDNGGNMLARTFLPLFNPKCGLLWMGLFEMDSTTPEQRTDFLAKVRASYEKF